jgi:hypothetical protein
MAPEDETATQQESPPEEPSQADSPPEPSPPDDQWLDHILEDYD